MTDIVERLKARSFDFMAELGSMAVGDETSTAALFSEAASTIEQRDAEIGRLRAGLGRALELIELIEQRSADNCWWVKADDPEEVVCATYDAVVTALSGGTHDGASPKITVASPLGDGK